jgi:hypothetical protein
VIRLLVSLLRVLAVLLLVRLGLRFVAAFLVGLRGGERRGPAALDGELVRDRVCNTFLPRSRALTLRVAGREQHFCSESCRSRALADAS